MATWYTGMGQFSMSHYHGFSHFMVHVLAPHARVGHSDAACVLMLAQALHAITFAAHHTVCIALVSHHFPGRLRGRGQALYSVLGYGLSGVIGGLAGGVVSSAWGLASVFWLSSACALLAMVYALRLWRLNRSAVSA